MSTIYQKAKTIITLIFLFPIVNKTFSQTNDVLIETAKKHMYAFSYDTSFQGEGWEEIKGIAEKHKYFLIGEDHGLAEVPLFTKELLKNIEYDLFVTEIDSVTAAISKQIASQKTDQIALFHTKNPSALSFYSAKEEFELLEILAQSNADIWGLDQISLFSTGIVFRRLSEVCKLPQSKEMTAQLADLSDQLFLEATRTGNYDTLFIFSTNQNVFDSLRETLKNESQGALSILNDIETSWKIYNGIDNTNYHSRIRGMKSKLLNNYVNSITNKRDYQKVLYKFGAYHVGRAESVLGYYDVGNLASNMADAEGYSSYHLMIVGKKGEMNSFLSAEGMEKTSFDIGDEKSALHGLLPLANLVKGDEWIFFDLKPLKRLVKSGKLEVQSRLLLKTIDGYDGLIIISEVTASSTL